LLQISTQFLPPPFDAPSILGHFNDQLLTNYFDGAQFVPRDNRIMLTFDVLWLWNYVRFRDVQDVANDGTEESTWKSIELMMKHLRDFADEMLKYSFFCDFCVFDILNSNDACTTKVYRLGNQSEGAEPIRDQSGSFRRIMYARLHNMVSSQTIMLSSNRFCEGLSLVHFIAQDQALAPLPYLSLIGMNDGFKRAMDLHLECSRQEGSELANPYLKVSTGFHITFYEVLPKEYPLNSYEKWEKRETWKVGYLHEKSGDLGTKDPLFRQSAFTVRLRYEVMH
jgi:hypothetical protein